VPGRRAHARLHPAPILNLSPSMRAALLGLCCAPLVCCGLRLPSDDSELGIVGPDPDEPTVKPQGRHIQYYHDNSAGGAGINDRIWMFNWLSDVATYNNATLHISGGPSGADVFLGKHSTIVNKWWARYLWVPPQCSNPFNGLQHFDKCEVADDADFDFKNPLFKKSANGCIVIMRMYNYNRPRSLPLRKDRQCHIQVNGEILKHAKQIVSNKGLPERFGAAHIRRCDRLWLDGDNGNVASCTSPASVAKAILSVKDVTSWAIFSYAERGYAHKLRMLLTGKNLSIVMEGGMELNPFRDGDNMYAYLVADSIYNKLADTLVETRSCKTGVPTVTRKSRDTTQIQQVPEAEVPEVSKELEMRRQEVAGDEASDSQLFGICGGKSITY